MRDLLRRTPLRRLVHWWRAHQLVSRRSYEALAYALAAPTYYFEKHHKKIDLRRIEGFSDLAARVIGEGRTFLREDRLYTLYQALQRTPVHAVAIEVGVYKGGGTRFISEVLAARGPGSRVYACDTFSGHAVTDGRYDGPHLGPANFSDIDESAVRAYLSGSPNVEILAGDIRVTAGRITDPVIHFIHVDVDVYPATLFVLETFYPRLAVGGCMVVDDYGFVTCEGARVAVEEFVARVPGCVRMHLLTGQALLVKSCA